MGKRGLAHGRQPLRRPQAERRRPLKSGDDRGAATEGRSPPRQQRRQRRSQRAGKPLLAERAAVEVLQERGEGPKVWVLRQDAHALLRGGAAQARRGARAGGRHGVREGEAGDEAAFAASRGRRQHQGVRQWPALLLVGGIGRVPDLHA